MYVFCSACLLGRYKFDDGDETDYHIPLMTLFQFTFYMGWLKVILNTNLLLFHISQQFQRWPWEGCMPLEKMMMTLNVMP